MGGNDGGAGAARLSLPPTKVDAKKQRRKDAENAFETATATGRSNRTGRVQFDAPVALILARRFEQTVRTAMAQFYRKDRYFTVTLYTGPNHLSLWLLLDGEQVTQPEVVQFSHPLCPALPPDDVRTAVLGGVNQANARYRTDFFPREIKFGIERWQGGDLVRRGAFMIVERLATLGPDRFGLLFD